ncbi:MAG: protein kinase [Deltaproteobacteria bacterium]|nr:protein kinase [Deltaproteobacteria bacterium]
MMNEQTERRIHPRRVLPTPDVGIVHPHYVGQEQDHPPGDGNDTLLVYLLNMSEGGFLLESLQVLEVNTEIDLWTRLPSKVEWQAFRGRVVWTELSPTKPEAHLLGVEFHGPALSAEQETSGAEEEKRRMYPSDLEFLINTPLLKVIPMEAKCPLLNYMTPQRVPTGTRFISQGDKGDTFYIIQEGTCVVNVEKNGTKHWLTRLRGGDIVGEIALLTGEPRTANVDAETDMVLWSLTREQFDSICSKYTDLLDFLTELVTHRFTTEKVTASRTIGKYLINELIGRGGWSLVYKGMHKSLNMPVAIKMLKHDMAMNVEFAEKFQNEARVVALLNHDNIVKVYDIEELYRTVFIIMEYLEGVPLDRVLHTMPKLPTFKVLDVLLQVCNGLSYAHEQGIVHQDIKPGNVFIQSDGRAKIVDFGLSCPPGTVDCGLPGTVYYMSPEQIKGDSIDERTDIYSLGIMAYEMTTGQRPYPEDDLSKLMELHVSEDIPDPRSLVPDLPDELHYFIKRATRRDPTARFKSTWEIIRDLQPFADKMGVERRPQLEQRRKMMSLFLFYQEDQQMFLNRLVENFNSEVNKMGVELKITNVDDV